MKALGIIIGVLISSLSSKASPALEKIANPDLRLFGSGLMSKDSGATIALACTSESGCTKLRWLISIPDYGAFLVGPAYQSNSTKLRNAISDMDLLGEYASGNDFETDPLTRQAAKAYINGLYRNSIRNFDDRSRNHTVVTAFGNDITSSSLAKLSDEKLAALSNKNFWNWSVKPQKIKSRTFISIAKAILMRALEADMTKNVWGPRSFNNYMKVIIQERYVDRETAGIMKRLGYSYQKLGHFEHGEEILSLFNRL